MSTAGVCTGPSICSYHPGVVGRYFSVTLSKDLYGQSEGESCSGMLEGCVEHEVCGGYMTEENTCFFWFAHNADPIAWMAESGNRRWTTRFAIGALV